MEAENSIKRKKRKTRKCLDEIRNRSRGIYFKSSVDNCNTRFDPYPKKSVLNEPKSSSNITTSRLTLAMFPKAVRSETITRPILTEIKRVPMLANISNKNKTIIDIINTNEVNGSDNAQSNSGDAQEQPSDTASNVHSISISSASSSEPIVLLENKSETDQTEESKSVRSIPTLSSASSQSPQVTYQNDFYEQLMNEIPFYLKKYTPNLIGRDPMKNNIAFIRKCHAETCQRECVRTVAPRINIKKFTKGNPDTVNETIVQNPKDYITLAWQHGAAVQTPPPAAPSSSPSDPTSPGPSPHASTPLSLATPLTPTIINDTPEYNYYPHRLN